MLQKKEHQRPTAQSCLKDRFGRPNTTKVFFLFFSTVSFHVFVCGDCLFYFGGAPVLCLICVFSLFWWFKSSVRTVSGDVCAPLIWEICWTFFGLLAKWPNMSHLSAPREDFQMLPKGSCLPWRCFLIKHQARAARDKSFWKFLCFLKDFVIPGHPKDCFLEVFCYIKPTKKHSVGCLCWIL